MAIKIFGQLSLTEWFISTMGAWIIWGNDTNDKELTETEAKNLLIKLRYCMESWQIASCYYPHGDNQ